MLVLGIKGNGDISSEDRQPSVEYPVWSRDKAHVNLGYEVPIGPGRVFLQNVNARRILISREASTNTFSISMSGQCSVPCVGLRGYKNRPVSFYGCML